jgi:hypothetical protein
MTTTAASHDALLAPASHDARKRRVPLGYWLAAAIAIVALIAAVGWAAARTFDVISSPDGFARVSLPGATTIPITASGKLVIYYEGTAEPSLGRLGVRVLDPSGRPVAVTAYRGDVRYDRAGLVAKAVGSFDAGTAGRDPVSAGAPTEASAKLAVGEDLGGAMKDTVLWAGLIMGAGAIAAAAIALRTHRRNRA